MCSYMLLFTVCSMALVSTVSDLLLTFVSSVAGGSCSGPYRLLLAINTCRDAALPFFGVYSTSCARRCRTTTRYYDHIQKHDLLSY